MNLDYENINNNNSFEPLSLKNYCLNIIIKEKIELSKKNQFLDISELPFMIQQQIDLATIETYRNDKEYYEVKLDIYDRLTQTILQSLEDKDLFLERTLREINIRNREISHLNKIIGLLCKHQSM